MVTEILSVGETVVAQKIECASRFATHLNSVSYTDRLLDIISVTWNCYVPRYIDAILLYGSIGIVIIGLVIYRSKKNRRNKHEKTNTDVGNSVNTDPSIAQLRSYVIGGNDKQ